MAKVGRPTTGETKKVSVTASNEIWKSIDNTDLSKSQFFKNAAEFYLLHLKAQSNHDKLH